MSRRMGKRGGCMSCLLVIALLFVVQMSWQVGCSEMLGVDGLLPQVKYVLYESLTRKRYSFLEFFLLDEEEVAEVVEVDGVGECVKSTMYSKMVAAVMGEHSFDLVSERRVAAKCLRFGLEKVLSRYKQFLNAKFVYKPMCLERICLKKPEKLYLEGLESLALSVYSLSALSEMVGAGGEEGFSERMVLALPSELEHKNEAISMIEDSESFDSYKEGLRTCMGFGMAKILIHPKLCRTELLSDFKVFSSIARILVVRIERHVNAYKRFKRIMAVSGESKYEKRMNSINKKILSLIKLLSYTTLTKFLILTDITNTESYEQIYESTVNSRNN